MAPVVRRTRRARLSASVALAAALALAPAAAAQGPVLTVDGASLGGPCADARTAAQVTPATPWCSVGPALRAAPAGAVVQVRAAAYPKVVEADVARPGAVTVRPFPGETPVIAGMDLSRVERLRFEGLRFSEGIVVRGGTALQFSGNELALRPAGPRTSSGIVVNSVRGVLIERNHIHDGRDGVHLAGAYPPSSDVVVWGNHIEDMGNDGVHVTSGTQRVLIASNVIEDVKLRNDVDPAAHADAIQATGPSTDLVLWGNYVLGGRGFLVFVSPRDVERRGRGHRGLVIENNVLLGREFALRTFSTPGARIVNNTIWGTSNSAGSGLTINDRSGKANDRSTGMVLSNNVLKRLQVGGPVSFAQRDHNLIRSGPLAGPHDRQGTPAFVDAGGGDFRLAPGSPGVDDADARQAPPVDAEGRLRHPRPDVGAFEATGTPAPGLLTGMPQGVAALLAPDETVTGSD